MKLVNDTYYDYIAVINGLEYPLGKQSSVDFRYVDNTRVVIKSTTKSSVHLDILDIILNIFFGVALFLKDADQQATYSEQYES